MAEPTTTTTPAQPRPPALPSTADSVPYVPVSWMAVGAAVVAALFIIVVLVSGYSAYKSRRPMIGAPELMFSLAAVAVLLSFAARRMIRDSDGTRTGQLFNINLPVVSWWVGLIGFLGYGAYFLAIEYSIQREAKSEVTRWVDFIKAGELNRAFHRTLEPGRRSGINPDDGKKIQDEFKEPLLAFTTCDLVRVTARNKDNCDFVHGGLRDWMYKDAGIECVYTGTLVCPEGRFPVRIPLKGFETVSKSAADGGVGRQWQIVVSQDGFIQREEVTRTKYGWMLLSLEAHGALQGNEFVNTIGLSPMVRPYVFKDLSMRSENGSLSIVGATQLPARIAAAGGPTLAMPYTPEYLKGIANFLRLPNGNEPSAKDQARFLAVWTDGRGIVPAGSILRGSIETSPTVTVTATAVQVRIPVEIAEQDLQACRGRLVVECVDPQVLADLQKYRDSADPNVGTREVPEDLRTRTYSWRVVRVESDMVLSKPPSLQSPSSPPVPGAGGR